MVSLFFYSGKSTELEDLDRSPASCETLGKLFNLSNLPFSYRLTEELLN